MNAAAPRRIWLCADDYGISPAVDRGIRDLISRRRLNATTAMVVAPSFGATAAKSLLDAGPAAIGLHVTLTAPFKPLTDFKTLRGGTFLTLSNVLGMAVARRLDHAALSREIGEQLRAFNAAFGRPPDFVDGHQHVQLFPQVRDAFLRAVAEHAPKAWVRQCGRIAGQPRRLNDRKGLLLDILSVGFRRKARRLGLNFNPAFAGTYSFAPAADFPRLFPGFLTGLPDGGLVMCHPGFSDAELERLDPLTVQRDREFGFFNGEEFARLLADSNVTLA
jgi:chitin disaccharide deacetylase